MESGKDHEMGECVQRGEEEKGERMFWVMSAEGKLLFFFWLFYFILGVRWGQVVGEVFDHR